MTALAEAPRFTFDEWSRIVVDPIKDRSYLSTQLGQARAACDRRVGAGGLSRTRLLEHDRRTPQKGRSDESD